MYRLINQNCGAVVQKLGPDIESYRELRSELESGTAETVDREEFRRRYRRYWRMDRARLSDHFCAGYFATLGRCYSAHDTNVEAIARELSTLDVEGTQPLQFSFATKLVHMVDPHLPVYDGLVAGFYSFVPPGARQFDRRLAALMDFYQFLQLEYSRVLTQGLLDEAICRFRSSHAADDICDQRVIDWLVWAWVALLRKGEQRHGRLLFD